ncbi:MAG: DUF2207 domain-containing protein [Candidatus Obscuribacterales bacterium]|nr:DUF2207 domain-containing protein [Candidatus Obscuribacterales bacterium]
MPLIFGLSEPLSAQEEVQEKQAASADSQTETSDADAEPVEKPAKPKEEGKEKTAETKGKKEEKPRAPELPFSEKIQYFETTLRLRKDCSLEINERIVIDFGNISRAGIYRMIPTRYNSYGNTFTMDVDIDSVSDQFGDAYPYDVSSQGKDLIIRIGDRDRMVRGVHTYRIQYTIRRAVNFFSKKPQLYWNLTGNEWPFPIERVKASFYPPPGTSTDGIIATCKKGSGSGSEQVAVSVLPNGIVITGDNLEPAEGLVLDAYLPQGLVSPPSPLNQIVWWFKSWTMAFIIPIVTFVLLLWQWYLTGGRLEQSKTIVPQRTPPKDLTPAEVGALVHGRYELKDVVSMLFDLACRGHFKIREARKEDYQFLSSRDYEFIKLPNAQKESNLSVHEQQFMQRLFYPNLDSVKLSDLRGNFSTSLPDIGNGVYQSLIKRKYFKGSPQNVRISYMLVSLLLCLLGVFFVVKDGPVALGLFVSTVVVLVMAPFMSAKTVSGTEVLRDCLGFKRFVEMSERDRVAKLAQDDANIFSKLLPYAMVLDAEQCWAENFRDLISKPPDWYEPWDYVRGYKYSTSELVDSIGQAIYLVSNTLGAKRVNGTGKSSTISG